MLYLLYWQSSMPVTVPVTVYVPDVIVRRLSTEGDLVVAEYKMGPPPEQWVTPSLWEESRTLLSGFQTVDAEAQRMYNALMLTMRQQKRVLEGGALTEFFAANRPDTVAAFVQKYGLFKFPTSQPEKIRVSIKDFRNEQKRLRALLRIWTMLREGESEEAITLAKEAGIEFAGDPHFALSVHLSAQMAEGSTLALIAIQGRLEPMLYCRDVITGLYALLFQAVVAGRPWSICLNCENVFSAEREGKKFCSERCQQALKQRRHRIKLKQKSKKRNRKR